MIEDYSFGRIVINGKTYQQDVIIHQGRVLANWWRKTGHSVDPDDIREVLSAKPDILVLGKGSPGLMTASPALRKLLENQGIQLIEQATAKAVLTFNRLLAEGKNISAGFHLTC